MSDDTALPPMPTTCPAWTQLRGHADRLAGRSLSSLVEARDEVDALELGELYADLTKHLVDGSSWQSLFALADQMGLPQMRDALFGGQAINRSEHRAVLHPALRAPAGLFALEGVDLGEQAAEVRARMSEFVADVHRGDRRGATGETFTHLLHVGIGGSELGPKLLVEALRDCRARGAEPFEVRFVSNIDGAALERAIEGLDPARTMVCVASKTFTTHETMMNAQALRDWLESGLDDHAEVVRHFVGVSAASQRAIDWGVPADQVFEFWEWVGGRYSMWSSIAFPLLFATSGETFEELLRGAHEADQHFRHEPWSTNLPVRLALLGVWYGAFFDAHTHAVVAYDDRLARLPSYLQQADMESNGKRVDRYGRVISEYQTGPVIWGGAGTNGQHAYFQLLHQGTRMIPVDFVVAATPHHQRDDHHDVLLANCFAQSQALMMGRDEDQVRKQMRDEGANSQQIGELAAQRSFPGNRPSTTLVLDRLSPRALGQLVATYEHKIFVQGVIWGLNSFDQWGVELGKQLALDLIPHVQDTQQAQARRAATSAEARIDASTLALLARVKHRRRDPGR